VLFQSLPFHFWGFYCHSEHNSHLQLFLQEIEVFIWWDIECLLKQYGLTIQIWNRWAVKFKNCFSINLNLRVVVRYILRDLSIVCLFVWNVSTCFPSLHLIVGTITRYQIKFQNTEKWRKNKLIKRWVFVKENPMMVIT